MEAGNKFPLHNRFGPSKWGGAPSLRSSPWPPLHFTPKDLSLSLRQRPCSLRLSSSGSRSLLRDQPSMASLPKQGKKMKKEVVKQAQLVHPHRIRVLKAGNASVIGPVVYWMFGDQRAHDNWAILHSLNLANQRGVPFAVVFNLLDQFLGAKARHFGFMLRGLREFQKALAAVQVPFFLLQGNAAVPNFLNQLGASVLVTDFMPLRVIRKMKDDICDKVGDAIAIHEVDAHNVAPVWAASDKLEYSARTIQSKIRKVLPRYLIKNREFQHPNKKWTGAPPMEIDWDEIISRVLKKEAEVPELDWCTPGEKAAIEVLMGCNNGFLTKRLKNYSVDRNSP